MSEGKRHSRWPRGVVRVLRPLASLGTDRRVLAILILLALFVGGRAWLAENPGSNPWAPLDLRDEPGWATRSKIAALRDDPAQCHAVLERSEVAFTALEPLGEAPCLRANRTRLDDFPYAGERPDTTCATAAALEIWRRDAVQPASRDIFGQEVAQIEHFGSFSCRRMYGRDEGPWSECWRMGRGSRWSTTGRGRATRPTSCAQCAMGHAEPSAPSSHPSTMKRIATTSTSIRRRAG